MAVFAYLYLNSAHLQRILRRGWRGSKRGDDAGGRRVVGGGLPRVWFYGSEAHVGCAVAPVAVAGRAADTRLTHATPDFWIPSRTFLLAAAKRSLHICPGRRNIIFFTPFRLNSYRTRSDVWNNSSFMSLGYCLAGLLR